MIFRSWCSIKILHTHKKRLYLMKTNYVGVILLVDAT
jgi:hypothetical protein